MAETQVTGQEAALVVGARSAKAFTVCPWTAGVSKVPVSLYVSHCFSFLFFLAVGDPPMDLSIWVLCRLPL